MDSSDLHHRTLRITVDPIFTLVSFNAMRFGRYRSLEMRRNKTPKIRIFCTLVVVTICAGCASTYSDIRINAENHVDLSDPAAGQAQIRAARWDIGLAGIYCYMTAPAKAERVTVNAGRVDITAACETNAFEDSWTDASSFSFNALPDHHYLIETRTCNGCIRLTDETTRMVVAEFPSIRYDRRGMNNRYAAVGIEEDLSTGNDTVKLIGLGECRLNNHEVGILLVDAGSINIDVGCTDVEGNTPSFRIFRSSFAFDAKTGHTYYFWRSSSKECIALFDTTTVNAPISCEPYESVE